jgi:OmcA/MtrC family decaheme c-type cytochrome
MSSRKWVFLLGGLALVGALASRPTNPFNPKQKAYYLTEEQLSFIRPGLVFKITGVTVGNDGVVRVRFTMTDPRGLPLDRTGITTPGVVSTSFVIAKIPKGGRFYEAYTTRIKTSTFPGTEGRRAKQASADSGGTYRTIATGEYEYTLATRLPADFPRNATHTVSIYGNRNLSEFNLPTNYESDIFTFVPDGSAIAEKRDVIDDRSCNACHDEINFHGGSRRGLNTCILCHTPAYADVTNENPETGNTIDMRVMTHKIHMGSSLPSVKAGTPYRFVGNRNTVADYSKVAIPSEANNCGKCHDTPASQNKTHLQFPSRAACGACHDDVNFATGANHANGLPQLNDNACSQCHIPQGEIDFDASILGAHVDPTQSSLITGIVVQIQSVTGTRAGERPTVNFTLRDRKGALLDPARVNRIAFTLAGPTTDYGEGLPVTGGYVTESAAAATSTVSGWSYRFNQAIPATARGTFGIYAEARRQEVVLEGTLKQRTIQTGSPNAVQYFSVDGSTVVPRRAIVSLQRCNDCHRQLSVHGENRNSTEACSFCHNARMTDVARRPANQAPAEAIDFSMMIHRIHAGKAQNRDYTLYGFGNTPHNYNNVGFPGELSNCENCHLAGTANLPIRAILDKTDPRGLITNPKPITAACGGCHTSVDAAAHSLANTSALGESCGACHGEGREYSITRVHAR